MMLAARLYGPEPWQTDTEDTEQCHITLAEDLALGACSLTLARVLWQHGRAMQLPARALKRCQHGYNVDLEHVAITFTFWVFL